MMKLSERMMAVANAWQQQKEYPPDATGGLRGYSAEVAQLESELEALRELVVGKVKGPWPDDNAVKG